MDIQADQEPVLKFSMSDVKKIADESVDLDINQELSAAFLIDSIVRLKIPEFPATFSNGRPLY
jgi:hypothetical protein